MERDEAELCSEQELERWLDQLFDTNLYTDEALQEQGRQHARDRQDEPARCRALCWSVADWGASWLKGFEQASSVIFEHVQWTLPSGRTLRVLAGLDASTREVVMLPSPSVYALMRVHLTHSPELGKELHVDRQEARGAGTACAPVLVPGAPVKSSQNPSKS